MYDNNIIHLYPLRSAAFFISYDCGLIQVYGLCDRSVPSGDRYYSRFYKGMRLTTGIWDGRVREKEEAENTVYIYSCGCRESEVANINSENSRFTWIIDVRTRNACTYSCNLYVYMNWRKSRCTVASRVCVWGDEWGERMFYQHLAEQRYIIIIMVGVWTTWWRWRSRDEG